MRELIKSLSRRRFTQLMGASAAYAVTRPGNSIAASVAGGPGAEPARMVRLNSNENPYGPSPRAIQAMSKAFHLSWRYPDEHADELIETIARINGVTKEWILLGDGSGEILKMCASAFTGPMTGEKRNIDLSKPTRGGALTFTPGRGRMVVADPTFEAILNHARVSGAEIVKVPLTGDFKHDLPKMLSAASDGLIYICNPNNPTASITPKSEMREFLGRAPGDTMVLVDEAYCHYADSADFESVIPLIKDHPNLIVARTFSKIYGMAGLRCGYCIAQPGAIQRMRPHQTWDSVSIMAIVAAIASLNDPEQVASGHRMNAAVRKSVTEELHSLGFETIPSQANFIMIDLKRDARAVITALRQHQVQVGRPFPSLPHHMRVTIGKQMEMKTFMSAFRQVT